MTPSHWARPRTPTAKETQPAEVPLPSAAETWEAGRFGDVLGFNTQGRGERLGILLGRSVLPTPISPFSGPQAKQLVVFSEWKSERRPVPSRGCSSLAC